MPRPPGPRRAKAAEWRSAVSDAHDFDELAVREVAERRALGEVLLGFDAAPELVRHRADDGDVAREPRLRSAIGRAHAGHTNHCDDVESHGQCSYFVPIAIKAVR